jgi:hypothetical protein
MNITFLKQIEVFMEKIVHHGCLFVCENFHEQILIKTTFFSPFVML